VLKRAVDLLVAGPLLVLALPLLAAVAVAVRLESPGKALFVQRRAGLRGKPFRILKFRTMAPDPAVPPGRKLADDPRVTRLGRILRRTSLDELPQLVNVVRGDMSLVGPRPEQVEIVDRYGPEERIRLEVKPGLTGPMQVYGRGDLSAEERLAVERDYVETLSLGRDLRILALTLAAVAGGRGAY
jgi:lipopolysaccharide/colanic/teichoic acid biosynthesis glycosyltransferase